MVLVPTLVTAYCLHVINVHRWNIGYLTEYVWSLVKSWKTLLLIGSGDKSQIQVIDRELNLCSTWTTLSITQVSFYSMRFKNKMNMPKTSIVISAW